MPVRAGMRRNPSRYCVTQYEITCVSGAGACWRSTLSVSMPGLIVQFTVSISIAQHGWFVDAIGVVVLLHSGKTVSVWFGLPKFVTSETEQSYGTASLPSMHGLPSAVLSSCAICVSAPERSCWQIVENVLRFGKPDRNWFTRTVGSPTWSCWVTSV